MEIEIRIFLCVLLKVSMIKNYFLLTNPNFDFDGIVNTTVHIFGLFGKQFLNLITNRK